MEAGCQCLPDLQGGWWSRGWEDSSHAPPHVICPWRLAGACSAEAASAHLPERGPSWSALWTRSDGQALSSNQWPHPVGSPWGRREPGHRALQLQGLPRRSSLGRDGHRPRRAREPWTAGSTGSAGQSPPPTRLGLLSGLALAASSPVGPPPSPHLRGWPRPGPVCREGRTLPVGARAPGGQSWAV